MKYLLLSAFLLGACATAPRSHIQPPSTTVLHYHVDKAADLSKQLKNQIAIARKLAPQIPALQLALTTANGQVDALTQELLDAKKAVVVLEKDNKTLAGQANAAIDRAKDRDLLAARYHKLKMLVCFVLAGAAGLLMFQLRWLLIPLGWVGLGIGAGLPAIVFTYAWWKL